VSKQFTLNDLTETIDQNPIYSEMKAYRERLRLVLTDVMEPLLFVSGPPGVGKSHHFFEVCQELDKSYQQIAPGGDPHSFVFAIWAYGRTHALLCDDHDRLLTAAKSRELVKTGWGPTRTIHWQTKSAMSTGMPPPEFKVTSRLIWLSNHDISKEIDLLGPIFDRGAQPLVIKGDDIDLFRYVVHAVVSDNFFKCSDGISKQAKQEALNWFVTNRHQLTTISLRTMQQAARYIQRAPSEDSKQTALASLLSAKCRSDFPGFGKLTMVKPGVWCELPDVGGSSPPPPPSNNSAKIPAQEKAP
jgi:hypothetical protein